MAGGWLADQDRSAPLSAAPANDAGPVQSRFCRVSWVPRAGRQRRLIGVTLCTALAALGAPGTQAAASRSCKPVVNPYAGSRYEGVDLRRVRAVNVRCAVARRVARGAHRKALGMTPPPSGIRSFRWRGWKVTGNLRGDVDHYLARRRGGKRVRWLF